MLPNLNLEKFKEGWHEKTPETQIDLLIGKIHFSFLTTLFTLLHKCIYSVLWLAYQKTSVQKDVKGNLIIKVKSH